MKGLGLLEPARLAWLGLVLPLLLLYVLKARREPRVISSLWLVAAQARDQRARQPWRRWVPELPFFLELAALTCAVLAVAQLYLDGAHLEATRVGFVVDVSSSMQAKEPGGQSRLELARAQLEALIATLPPGAEAFVVTAASPPRLVLPPERDRARLRRALHGLSAEDGGAALSEAVRLASERLSGSPHPRLVLATDHPEPELLAQTTVPVETVLVGTALSNTSIDQVDVRVGRSSSSRQPEAQVFARVTQHGRQPREIWVTLHQRSVVGALASRKLLLKPGETTPVVLTFPVEPADGGAGLSVELSPGDALEADDRAYLRLPESRNVNLLISPPKSQPSLQRAFESDGDVTVTDLTPSELGSATPTPDSLLIASGFCPAAKTGHELLVAPPAGNCRGVLVGAELDPGPVLSLHPRDSRLRFLKLDELHVARTRQLRPRDERQLLVGAQNAPLLVDASTVERVTTLLGFEPGTTDWPKRASFVIFVRNLLEQVRERREHGARGSAAAGQPFLLSVPADVRELQLEGTDGREQLVQAREGRVLVPPQARAGFVFASWQGASPGSQLVAVNRNAPAESDLSAAATAPVLRSSTKQNGVQPPATPRRSLGPWLALLAFVCAAAELLWLTRRRATPLSSELLAGLGPALRSPTSLTLLLLGLLPSLYTLALWLEWLDERLLRLEQPLLAIPLSLFCMVLAVRLPRLAARSGRARGAMVRGSFALVQVVLAWAALSPEFGRATDRMAVWLLVDRSRSIDHVVGLEPRLASEQQVAELGMRPADRLGRLVFGGDSAIEQPLRAGGSPVGPGRVEVPRAATDLELAIRRALGELPADASPRLVLMSDGVATHGDAENAALLAAAAGVPIDVLALEQSRPPNIRLASLRAPGLAALGETLELRLTLSSPQATSAVVRFSDQSKLVGEQRVTLPAGQSEFTLHPAMNLPGLRHMEVEVVPDQPELDPIREDDRASVFVSVLGPARALLISEDSHEREVVGAALNAAELPFDSLPVASIPTEGTAFTRYDVILLGAFSAARLSIEQLSWLAAAPRDLGIGLLLLGGQEAFGPGGYGRTPIEEVSPVTFDLKQLRRRASLAELIVVDYSGSMGMSVGGGTKLSLANEAALRSASLLGPLDRLGVNHVDTKVQQTWPLGPVTELEAISQKVRAVRVGGGGILVDLALRDAYATLGKERTNLRHLLLFADGDDAEERTAAPTLAKTALAAGITTSVVSLGKGSDTAGLEALSRAGGGRFYLVEDASRLPAVFAQETITASLAAFVEDPFRASVHAEDSATRGIDWSSVPALGGYTVTLAKARADIPLMALDGDPLLAVWNVGLGRVAVFTSDLGTRWSGDFARSPNGLRFFGQLARSLTRRAEDPHLRVAATAEAGQLQLSATALDDDGRVGSFRRLRARVLDPDGHATELPLEAVRVGGYHAQLGLTRPGAYLVSVTDETRPEVRIVTGVELDQREEAVPLGTDRRALERIAQLSGGKVRDTLAGLFRERSQPRIAFISITSWLLLLGWLGWLLSVAARRLQLPDWLNLDWTRSFAISRARTGPAAASLALKLAPRAHTRVPAQRDKPHAATPLDPPLGSPAQPAAPPTPAPARAAPQPTLAASEPTPVAVSPAPAARGQSTVELLVARRRRPPPTS